MNVTRFFRRREAGPASAGAANGGRAPAEPGPAAARSPEHDSPEHDSPEHDSPEHDSPERILRRLEWQVIRRLDGQLQGDYRSLFYGYGVDFADLREYQPEDDIRYIDWNVTARMDTPYVRQYMEDREVTAWFLLDLSPSMDFGTAQSGAAPGEKRALMIDLVATLARLLTRHGNRVGAILYSGQAAGARGHRAERLIPAKGGRNHVLWLINDLLKQPRLPRAGFTDLKVMLEGGLYSIKKRSLIFVISDFISAPGWEQTLNLLNRRHEVIAVRLWDPSEVELPDVGPLWMEDAETGEQMYVDTHDPRFRAAFALLAESREETLNTAFRHAGVEPWSVCTGEDLVRAITRYAELRRRAPHKPGAAGGGAAHAGPALAPGPAGAGSPAATGLAAARVWR